jgi:hypothetical protein
MPGQQTAGEPNTPATMKRGCSSNGTDGTVVAVIGDDERGTWAAEIFATPHGHGADLEPEHRPRHRPGDALCARRGRREEP